MVLQVAKASFIALPSYPLNFASLCRFKLYDAEFIIANPVLFIPIQILFPFLSFEFTNPK